MPRPLGSLLVTSALLLGAPFASRCQDASLTPSTDTGFDAVTVNLRLGTFENVLPFDVPFWINGQVPGSFNRVEVRYRALDKKGDSCADASRWATANLAVWQLPPAFAPADGATPPQTQSFRVTIDRPLAPERFYCFLFTPMIDPPRALVNQAVAEATDEASDAARSTDDGAAYAADVWNRAQRKLLERLGAGRLKAAGEIQAPPLSALTDEQRARLTQESQDVVNSKEAVRTANQAFVDQSQRLDEAADAAQQSVDPEAVNRIGFQLGSQLDNVLETTPGIEGSGPRVTSEEVLSPEETAKLIEECREKLRLLEETYGATRLERAGASIVEQGWTLRGLAQDQIQAAEKLAPAHARLADEQQEVNALLADYIDGINVSGTTSSLTPSTQFNNYVSADVGLLYGPDIEEVVPYMGVNFYFRPINKAAPVRGGLFSKQRVALTIGLTLTDAFVDVQKTREPLFSNQALLIGGGVRLTPSLRLGAGALLFRKTDPNPLSNDTTLGVSGYVSLTFDLNVVKLFGKLGDAVFPGVN